MMEQSIIAVVVVYHPDTNLLIQNIEAFVDEVDKLVIWLNSPIDKSLFLGKKYWNKIDFANNGNNTGISKALNYVYHQAEKLGFNYLLTMDQDSIWIDFEKFREFVFKKNREKPWIIGPGIVYSREGVKEVDRNSFLKDDWAITSGMLIPVDILKEIGGYNEFFKVDGIDIDVCLRAKRRGFFTCQSFSGILIQRFGETKRKCGFIIREYNAQRLYCIVKSHVILYRTYKNIAILKELCDCLKMGFLSAIFIRRRRINKLKSIITGITEGIFTKYEVKTE